MSLSRHPPAARPPSPGVTPWPTFSAPSAPCATSDASTASNMRQGHSPTRSPRKMKGRARQDRDAEEDIRFNIAPKWPRAMFARRLMRRTRPERVIDPFTMDIPDYPPPTFQEATSGLALQIPATVVPTESSADLDALEDEHEIRAGPSRINEQTVQQSASATSDSDSSSSHSSQDFCDLPSDETVPSTPRKKSQHGLAFPCTPLRGRNKSRAMRHDAEASEPVAQPAAATRRHNSLSPLRILPSLHLTLHDRAATAHPTTEHASSSPYQHSRGMSSFFRSTTSLALLHSNGNTTPTTLKSKTSMTNLSSNGTSPKRKLFSPSKGKERAERLDRPEKVEIDPEIDQLDTWEVIDATEVDDTGPSIEFKAKKEERRRNPDPTAETPVGEPFRAQTEAITAAPVSISVEAQAHRPPQPPQVQTQQPSVHPLSLRDRKVPIPPERTQQRLPPQSVPPRPNSPPAISPATSRIVQSHDPPLSPSTKLSTGPPITTVRVTRKQTTGTTHTLTTKRSQVFNSSPLGTQTWKPGDESPITVGSNLAAGLEVDVSMRTALETPLPPSPVESAWSGTHLGASTKTSAGFSKEFQSVMADIAGLQFTPLTDSFSAVADVLGLLETPTRKHYHGRPLPPAPGPAGPGVRPPIDSVYLTQSLPSEKDMNRNEKDKGKDSNCPEGLLIDLDDNTFVNSASTREAARSQTGLRLLPPPASPTVTGLPVSGNGNGHRWHATSASMSTPNLASQPAYPSPLQAMTPNLSQGSPVPHVWAPLHAVTAEPQWGYDSETDDELPEYEASKYWAKQPISLASKDIKVMPPSPHVTHAQPFALALARAQTHPAASPGVNYGMVPLCLHTSGGR